MPGTIPPPNLTRSPSASSISEHSWDTPGGPPSPTFSQQATTQPNKRQRVSGQFGDPAHTQATQAWVNNRGLTHGYGPSVLPGQPAIDPSIAVQLSMRSHILDATTQLPAMPSLSISNRHLARTARVEDLRDIAYADPSANRSRRLELMSTRYPGIVARTVSNDMHSAIDGVAFGMSPETREKARHALVNAKNDLGFAQVMAHDLYDETGRFVNVVALEAWRGAEMKWRETHNQAPETPDEMVEYLAPLPRNENTATIFNAMTMPNWLVEPNVEALARWQQFDQQYAERQQAAAGVPAPGGRQAAPASPANTYDLLSSSDDASSDTSSVGDANAQAQAVPIPRGAASQANLLALRATTDPTVLARRAELANLIRANPTASNVALTGLMQQNYPGVTLYRVREDRNVVTSDMAFGLPPESLTALRRAAATMTTPASYTQSVSVQRIPEQGRSFNLSRANEWNALEVAWRNRTGPTTDDEISEYLSVLERTPENASIFAAMVLPPGWVGSAAEAYALWNDHDNNQLAPAATLMARQAQQPQPLQQPQPQPQPQAQAQPQPQQLVQQQPQQPAPTTQSSVRSTIVIPAAGTPQVHLAPLAGQQTAAQTAPVLQPATSSMTTSMPSGQNSPVAISAAASPDVEHYQPLNTPPSPGTQFSNPFDLNILQEIGTVSPLPNQTVNNTPTTAQTTVTRQQPQMPALVDLMDVGMGPMGFDDTWAPQFATPGRAVRPQTRRRGRSNWAKPQPSPRRSRQAFQEDFQRLLWEQPHLSSAQLLKMTAGRYPTTTLDGVRELRGQLAQTWSFGLPSDMLRQFRSAVRASPDANAVEAAMNAPMVESDRVGAPPEPASQSGRVFNASALPTWHELERRWGKQETPLTHPDTLDYLVGLDRNEGNAHIFAALVLPGKWAGTNAQALALWQKFDQSQILASADLDVASPPPVLSRAAAATAGVPDDDVLLEDAASPFAFSAASTASASAGWSSLSPAGSTHDAIYFPPSWSPIPTPTVGTPVPSLSAALEAGSPATTPGTQASSYGGSDTGSPLMANPVTPNLYAQVDSNSTAATPVVSSPVQTPSPDYLAVVSPITPPVQPTLQGGFVNLPSGPSAFQPPT